MKLLLPTFVLTAALLPGSAHAAAPTASTSCAAPASSAPPIVCSGCDVTGAKVRARSDRARVFTAPDGAGRSLYGCLLSKGKPRRLGSAGAYSDRRGVHQDSWRLIRLRGRYAALERHHFGCPSADCRNSQLQVYDLRSGRRTIRRTTEPSAHYWPGASDIALARDGSVAWISNRGGGVWHTPASTPRAAKKLARGAEPRSLRLVGTTLSWVRAGTRRYVEIS